jgi:serine acetyltransferase
MDIPGTPTPRLPAAEIDIKAIRERDPACNSYSTPLLFYKGFHALQSYRVAHWLSPQERHSLAFYFQNQMRSILGADIHPAAKIGCGIMFDHATGIVIGETAVVEDDITMLVTLVVLAKIRVIATRRSGTAFSSVHQRLLSEILKLAKVPR